MLTIVGAGAPGPAHLPGPAGRATVRRVTGPLLRERALLVRAAGPRDAADLAALAEDPDVRRWLPPEGPADQAVGAPAHRLVVEVAGAFAGTVLLRPDGEGGAWLTCAAPVTARGAGTTAAAVRLVLTWAFAELGLQAVHWRAEAGAWSGRRLAWACGSSVEGVVRSLLPVDGDRRDAWVGTWRWDDALHPRERWLAPVELAGGGVRLGPHGVDDVTRIAEACSAPTTQAWLPSLPAPYTLLDAAGWVAGREEEQAAGTGVYWAVRAQGPDAAPDLLAEVGLFALSEGACSGEVGYWCHPEARGRGVTAAAVRLVAAHALAPVADGGLGLERVLLRVARGNLASRRVAVACGFRAVGVDRGAERLRDGTVDDFVRYDLLAPAARVPDPAPGPVPAPGGEVGGAAGRQTAAMTATAPGDPSLRRVTVVVDLAAALAGSVGGLESVADDVAAALPWADLPAMADEGSRTSAVVAAPDSRSLEVVLLVEAVTDEDAERDALAAVRTGLGGAGLAPEAATPSQMLVQDAYTP